MKNMNFKIKYYETKIGRLSKDSREDWEQVYNYYLKEGSYNKLQEYLGINKSTIFRVFKKFNFSSLAREEYIRRNVAGTKNTKKIKKENGFKVHRVKKHSSTLKLEENKDLIIKLYFENKVSLSKISRMFGISSGVVKKYLKNFGIVRTFTESMSNLAENFSNNKNIDFFNVIDTEEKAYWLGFIYADGNINKNKTLLTIGLKDIDENHLLKFSSIFNKRLEKRKLRGYKNIKSNRVVVYCRISSSYLCKNLVEKGIKPRKTYEDNIEVLRHVPDKLFNHFIRGLFDGDGCIYMGKHNNCGTHLSRITFILNKSLACYVNNFFEKYLSLNKVKVYNKKYHSTIQYGSNNDIKKLYNFMYQDATRYLERKKDIFDNYFKLREGYYG